MGSSYFADDRSFRVRAAQDYDPYQQGGHDWNTFSPGDVDPRHQFHAYDVPVWDRSPQAEQARDFARWKDNNPGEYAQINNLSGNAEMWFAKNRHKLNENKTPDTTGPAMMGFSFMIGGFTVGIPAGIMTWLILGLMYTQLGWDIHWTLFILGTIFGIITMIAGVMVFLGIAVTLLFSPLLLVHGILSLLAFIFSSKVDRMLAKQRRAARKKNQQDLKAEKAEAKQNRKNARKRKLGRVLGNSADKESV